MSFSERYGYVKPTEVLKRGSLDAKGSTALCNCYDNLAHWLNLFDVDNHSSYDKSYTEMEEMIWCFFLNQRRNDFYDYNSHKVVATQYLLSKDCAWYLKFDLIEFSIRVLRTRCEKGNMRYENIVNAFVNMLNATFIRLNYAYRIVNDIIVEITDDEEIMTIETAINQESTIKTHFSCALKLLSNRPTPDYRNSIKESISAVEALCREITTENTLGDALKKLEKSGVNIPAFLKSGFEKLYIYTNNEKTGIRHALMDNTEPPKYDEAKFMLVSCCAFVNYIQGKRSTIR